MDGETKEAITHPSLKLIAGAGGIVLVAGILIWAKTHQGRSSASASAPPPGGVGAFAPTSLTINNPAPTGPTASKPTNPGSSSGSSSGGGSKTPKPPTKKPVKTPAKTTRPVVHHPRVTKSTPAKTSHPTGGGTGAGIPKSHDPGNGASASSPRQNESGGVTDRLGRVRNLVRF